MEHRSGQTMIVKANPLTSDVFTPFGQVLMGGGKGSERHPYAARIKNLRTDARPNMTFMRVPIMDMPVQIAELERHVYSNQTFIPLNGTRQLVVVCASQHDETPDINTLAAFIAEGSQAVNYNPGVWHAPRTAIGGPGEFVMFRWDEDNDRDTELFPLDEPIEIK
jgi:ureidoglycolate lyase